MVANARHGQRDHAQLGQNRVGSRAGPTARAAGPRATVGQDVSGLRLEVTRVGRSPHPSATHTRGHAGGHEAGQAAFEAASGPARALGRRLLGAAVRLHGIQLDQQQLAARPDAAARTRAPRRGEASSQPSRDSARRVGRSAQGVLAPSDLPLGPLRRAGSLQPSHPAAAHQLLTRRNERRRLVRPHQRLVSSSPRAPPLAASHRDGRREAASPQQ